MIKIDIIEDIISQSNFKPDNIDLTLEQTQTYINANYPQYNFIFNDYIYQVKKLILICQSLNEKKY